MERKSFVKYLSGDFSGRIEKSPAPGLRPGSIPLASVIIPSLDGYRSGYLPALLKQIKEQGFQDFELIIAQGDPYQGRAINAAAAAAAGEILIILDDDTRLGNGAVFRNLVAALRGDPSVGMAGVANLIPADAPWLVKRTMQELPRRHSSPVSKITDSDMAEHPCCAIPKKAFYEIGGEREDIRRGLDPYLRNALRRRGFRVVVIPDTWIHHLPPDTFPKLARQLFRNGMVVGLDRRTCQEAPYEVPDGHVSRFPSQRGFGYRLARFLWRILRSLLTLQLISLAALLLYALGFTYGRFFKRQGSQEISSSLGCQRHPWGRRKLRVKFFLKKICKVGIIIILTACGYLHLKKLFRRNKKRVMILAYHRISNSPGNNYAVKEEEFKKHILHLLHNYHIVSLQRILDYIKGNVKLPDNALAITFDDGYEELYHSAYPLLKMYNLPACIFLVTGYMDTQARFSWDEWFGLENNKLLTWAQVRQMSENGITFGIHTSTHPDLARLNAQEVAREIALCGEALEKALGKKAECFAYPFGSIRHMNEITREVIMERGLKCALTSIYGTVDLNSDLFQLRRIVIDGSDNFYIFKQKINGRLDILSFLGCSFWQGLFVRINKFVGLER